MTTTREDAMAVDPAWAEGAAYVDGRFCPVAEAAVPALDWGYRRSDVCYDVVGVWQGAFFRLDDHLARFARSRAELRMEIAESDAEIAAILHELVRRSGLRSAYVAMDALRGRPRPGAPRHPAHCRPWLMAMAIPWVWVIPEDVQARGAHLIVAATLRIDDRAVDPTVKNFHWGDLTRALFEAGDAGADNAILLDREGFVTEGPGFNVCAVIGRTVVTPDRGALEGITRRSVGELCAELGLGFEIRPLPVEELRDADEVFLATTAGGVMPVARVDSRIYGNDRPGPISAALRERFWAKRAEGWHATPIDYGERA
jgi:branched-chain amino acid aminotransferase